MFLKFFTIPAHDSAQPEAELNRFLGMHRIVSVERHFVADSGDPFWAVCVCHLVRQGAKSASNRERIDYREVLSETDFAVFAKLRTKPELPNEEGV